MIKTASKQGHGRVWRALAGALALSGGVAWAAPTVSACVVRHALGEGVQVEAPWARATVAGQTSSGAYMVVRNTGSRSLRLIGACSPAIKTVQIHEMRMRGDVMEMREVDHVDIAPHGTATFASGNLHLMFMDLNQPLRAGTAIPVILHFQEGDVAVRVPVSLDGAASAP
jgi:copper(I)-binding protein